VPSSGWAAKLHGSIRRLDHPPLEHELSERRARIEQRYGGSNGAKTSKDKSYFQAT